MKSFFLGRINDSEWNVIRSYCLNKADRFTVHGPRGNGPLSYGLEKFKKLPHVKVVDWEVMENAIEISGNMTPEIRALFFTLDPSVTSWNPESKLWDYQLYIGKRVLLSIGDYADLVLSLTDIEIEDLKNLGIRSEKWLSA